MGDKMCTNVDYKQNNKNDYTKNKKQKQKKQIQIEKQQQKRAISFNVILSLKPE